MQPQQMLHGIVLKSVAQYLDYAGIFDAGSLFLAWRKLSRRNREVAVDEIAYREAGMVVLTAGIPSQSMFNKLDFICFLGCRLQDVTIESVEKLTMPDIARLRERLERCPHIRRVKPFGRGTSETLPYEISLNTFSLSTSSAATRLQRLLLSTYHNAASYACFCQKVAIGKTLADHFKIREERGETGCR